jgi:hypothetical protein
MSSADRFSGYRSAGVAHGDGLARQWFIKAIRWYVEEHQGCPRCRGRHCVFRATWGSRIEYHCTECDFSAAHDETAGTYAANLGEPTPTGVPLEPAPGG